MTQQPAPTRAQALKMMLQGTAPDVILDVYKVAGPYNAERRQQIMQAITGERRPKAQCGVNAIREMVMREHPQQADECLAQWERRVGLIIAQA